MKCTCLFIMFIMLVTGLSAEDDQKTIELVLDSSGSMNSKLPDGEKRIDAAKKAIEELISDLPDNTILAFRAYGHQSSKFKQDCNDTALLVPFGQLSDVKSAITDQLKKLEPRGFTPTTKALQLAAADFKNGSTGSRTIILVSDGKETCEGDPCVAARELQRSGINLAVHTIGLGVDFATRSQLRCIARATGGSYFDAENTTDLSSVLNQAGKKDATQVQIDKGTGFLEIPNVVASRTHDVIDAATEKEVARISFSRSKVELPAGVYHVTFGKDVWKSIEVKPGETTVLNPGKLIIEKNSPIPSHKVVHTETGKEHGVLGFGSESILLVPGDYDVTFAKIVWPSVRVDAGKDTVIRPGGVLVTGMKPQDLCKVFDRDGTLVQTLGFGSNKFDLPPGEYTIDIAGKKQTFTIEDGKVVEFSSK